MNLFLCLIFSSWWKNLNWKWDFMLKSNPALFYRIEKKRNWANWVKKKEKNRSLNFSLPRTRYKKTSHENELVSLDTLRRTLGDSAGETSPPGTSRSGCGSSVQNLQKVQLLEPWILRSEYHCAFGREPPVAPWRQRVAQWNWADVTNVVRHYLKVHWAKRDEKT